VQLCNGLRGGPGKSPFPGDYQLNNVVAGDDLAVALTTVSAQRDGKALLDDTVQVFRIRDGKATEVWSYPADVYANDAFWS
jgi:ketosteroid isomerase-like protein